MLPAIEGLCGRPVSNVRTSDWGSVHFQLGDVFVNIAFPISLRGSSGDVNSLEGRILERLCKDDDFFCFKLREGITLAVDLKPQRDCGPEAVAFGFPGGADVVI